ncbi:hypothetical protein [Fulvivirga sp.]|uniref:hypothetical protein n=1 Tax=Fulvivirga sp. TaxID=1931237 RepID=UPI0032ED9BFE
MKNTGIWLDKRNAIIVQIEDDKETIEHITSNIDEGNAKGGARSSTPYGPQDVVSEKHMLERRKLQQKKYFQELISVINNPDQLLIFGPANTKKSLLGEIATHNELKDRPVFIENADSMTLPQIKAKVREFFKEQESRK